MGMGNFWGCPALLYISFIPGQVLGVTVAALNAAKNINSGDRETAAIDLLPSALPRADPGVQAVCPQVTIIYPPNLRLPLLSARPAVTFPAAQHHRPLASTKLYCLVTEAHGSEQLAQGSYAAFAPNRI